jgi:hypothetical protein
LEVNLKDQELAGQGRASCSATPNSRSAIRKTRSSRKADVSNPPETQETNQNSTIESNNSFSFQSQADRSKENCDPSNSLKNWEDKRNMYHEEIIDGEVITAIHRKKKTQKEEGTFILNYCSF